MNEREPTREPRARGAHPSRGRRPLGPRWSVVPVVLVGALSVAAGRAPDGAEDVDQARATLEQWVETRRLISQEKRDWALGKELLSDRIAVYRGEIESLREKIEKAETSIADTDRKRAELLADSAALKEASQDMAERVAAFEQRTKELLPRLPQPIQDSVLPLSQQLPDDPAATDLSLSQRFQNVVGILNLVNKFNGKITITSEVRTLPDGTTAEVTAMYVGIAHGYYVDGRATRAGVGRSDAEGWAWTPADEYAEAIARAIAINGTEEGADFVQLPVHVE